MRRRETLSVAGIAVATALAGCPGDGTDSGDGEEAESGGGDGAQSPPAGTFTAESESGFVAFGVETDSEQEAVEEGLSIGADDRIVVEGDVLEDDRWESTRVAFPALRTGRGVEANVEAPDGLGGEFTDERMTAEGAIRIVIEAANAAFSFDVAATTGRSNALRGEAALAAEPPHATLVDNEFTVDDGTGNTLVDDRVGVPAPEPGSNWFELELAFVGE